MYRCIIIMATQTKIKKCFLVPSHSYFGGPLLFPFALCVIFIADKAK